MRKLIISNLLFIFICSGCCRIMTGPRQEIPITSNPSGATITVTNGPSIVTPNVINIQRKGQYNVTAELEGYQSETIKLKRNLNNWLWADLLWDFGIITWPIDFLSGSAYDYKPKSLHFDMRPAYIISEDGKKLKVTGYTATIDSQGRPVTVPVYEEGD